MQLDSKSGGRKAVWVRVPPPVPRYLRAFLFSRKQAKSAHVTKHVTKMLPHDWFQLEPLAAQDRLSDAPRQLDRLN